MNFFYNLKNRFEWIAQKSKLPEIKDATNEQYKLSIIRIVIGILILVRNAEIVYAGTYLGVSDIGTLFGCIYLIVLVAFTIGLFTPLTSVFIFATYVLKFSNYYETHTLADTTFLQLLTIMIFLNHGSKLSVDAWILSKNNIISKILRQIYAIIGFPKEKDFKIIYFYGFMAYALVSFGAFLYHVTDTHWIKGYTIQALLVNSYLCKYYNFFREIEAFSPELMKWNSYFGLIGQSIFQIFMLPLVYFTWGKRFVNVWGWIFFLMSLFFIQLSYLPHTEILLWIVIFHTFKLDRIVDKNKKLEIRLPYKYRLYPAVFFYTIIPFLYVMTNYRVINNITYKVSPYLTAKISWCCYAAGYALPIVFNKTDLALGNNWIVLEKKVKGKYQLVPFSGYDGNRLPYFTGFDYFLYSNHGSDVLYYGTILQKRRKWGIIQTNPNIELKLDKNDKEYVQLLAQFDYNYKKLSKPTTYRATFYSTKSNDATLSLEEKYKKKVLETFEITIEK